MSGLKGQRAVLEAKFRAILPHLDERQRRLLIGAEAQSLGHGGIRAVARAAGVREATVSVGMRELDSGEAPLGGIRRPGGGRKRVVDLNPAVREALLTLVEPDVRGDPVSPLRWTTKSPPRKRAEQLTRRGHKISADTVGDLLREEGFSLQSNAKTLEGKQHPDRDAQFHYLNEQARDHQDSGAPVISVDTKKKELVGPFKNNGREWEPRGEPVRVDTHDFHDRVLGRAVPYGIYDVVANTGWVNVGTDHDTAAFAVEYHHPDSTQALVRIGEDRRAALNRVLEPSGIQVDADEYTLLYGPVLARLLLDRGPITDTFIDAVVAQWLSTLRCTEADPRTDLQVRGLPEGPLSGKHWELPAVLNSKRSPPASTARRARSPGSRSRPQVGAGQD